MHISDFGSESVGLLLVFNVCVPKQRGLARDIVTLCAAADKFILKWRF